ncbi:MAG: malate synthase A [Bacteroidota bacterium]
MEKSPPTLDLSEQLEINMPLSPPYQEMLTERACSFLLALHQNFDARRKELLSARVRKQKELDSGALPTFLPETVNVRESDWKVAPLPADLQDRRVEITGPVSRKMVINALNSGAKVFMADFEDANAPSWENCLDGQINLRDAAKGDIAFYDANKDKHYQLNEETATLMVRPRGWHLEEKNIQVKGSPVSGSLVDFGLFFFHNAKTLISRGSGPYFYLPKLESHLEARLWNDVFVFAQNYLDIPIGTIKATVLIETILASFEMDEILYELRDHSAGLNCGRWDYIFSYIKKLGKRPEFLVPNRAQVGMTAPFMAAYSKLVIQTCHKRGVHAMGGMAAQIPIKGDPEANAQALEKVRQDKLREASNGHDGTWVAHPGLVGVAMEVFDAYMPEANQINVSRPEESITPLHLIEAPEGSITEEGIRINIDVGIQYIASWLAGNGCVPIYNLMEDAATAEICRTQLWQWIQHSTARLDDGRAITESLYGELLEDQVQAFKTNMGEEAFQENRFPEAIDLFNQLVLADDLEEFLTLPAYQIL